MPHKIVILGAGAIGSLFGGKLAQKYDVFLISRREAHIAAINAEGLRLSGITEAKVQPRAAVPSVSELLEVGYVKPRDPKLLILTVKSYDTAAALQDALPILDENSILLSLQNGLDNIPKIMETVECRGAGRHCSILSKPIVLAGTTSHGATYIAPGHVRHAGLGKTVIGAVWGEGAAAAAHRVAEMFNSVGIETEFVHDVDRTLWEKAIINAAINPLTAILRVPNGYLLKHAQLQALLCAICEEAVRVAAAAATINFDAGEIVAKVQEVAKLTAENKSSMLQDLQRGKPTEIASINGMIVSLGEKHGVETPLNSMLVTLLKALEQRAK
jgi:2-dehydropantoate 2-reductase